MPKLIESSDKGVVDVAESAARFTLDIICESAMGRNLDVQHIPDAEFPKAMYSLSRILSARIVSCFYFHDP